MNKDTPRRLRHASGYLELGLLDEGLKEIEAIAPEDRAAAPVLTVAIELHMTAKHWAVVIGMGCALARERPADERGWICWAYALRELGRLEEARTVLLQAEPQHGATSAVLHYNLACYYCLLGELEVARQRLAHACQMEPSFKQGALNDPDLKALVHPRK